MKNKYRQVNWKDGMIIESNHFIEMENFFVEQDNLTRSLFLNEFNYGLLPSTDEDRAFKIEIALDNNRLLIKDLQCYAMTIDGSLIMIDIKDYKNNLIDHDFIPDVISLENIKPGNYDLIIKVNPFERIDFGEINSDITPYRRTSVLPHYELVLNPITGDRNVSFGDNFFAIARLSFENNKLVKYDYIPPSVSVKSHPLLDDFSCFIFSSFVSIENYLSGFVKTQTNIQRAYDLNVTSTKIKEEKSLFLSLTTELLKYVSQNKFSLTYQNKYSAPVFYVEKVINLAVIANIELSLVEQAVRDKYIRKVNEELEEQIKVQSSKVRTSQGLTTSNYDADFMTILNNFINYSYNHIKLIEAVDITEKFLNSLMSLCNVLTSSAMKQPVKKQFDIYLK